MAPRARGALRRAARLLALVAAWAVAAGFAAAEVHLPSLLASRSGVTPPRKREQAVQLRAAVAPPGASHAAPLAFPALAQTVHAPHSYVVGHEHVVRRWGAAQGGSRRVLVAWTCEATRCGGVWRAAARRALAAEAAAAGVQGGVDALFVTGGATAVMGRRAAALTEAEREAFGDVVALPVPAGGGPRRGLTVLALSAYLARYWGERFEYVVLAQCGVLVRLSAALAVLPAPGSPPEPGLLAAKCLEAAYRASDVQLSESACFAALGVAAYATDTTGASGKASSSSRRPWAVAMADAQRVPRSTLEALNAAAASGFAGADPKAILLGVGLVRALAEYAERGAALSEADGESEAALLVRALAPNVTRRAMLRGCAMPGCVGDGERWCGESSHGSPASLSFVAGLDADAMEGVVDALARVGKLCFTKCYAAAAALRRGDDAACGGMRAQLAPPLDAAPQLLSQPTLPTVDAELPVLLIALDGKRGAASEAQLRRRHPHLTRVGALDARGGAKGLDAMDAAAQGAKTLVSGGTNSATEIGCSVSHLRAAAMVAALNLSAALVAEDDASFELAEHWAQPGLGAAYAAELPPDWAVLQLLVHAPCDEFVGLHAAWREAGRPPAMPHVHDTLHSTGAYLLSRRGAEAILRRFTDPATLAALYDQAKVARDASGDDEQALAASVAAAAARVRFDLSQGCARCNGCVTADRCVVYGDHHRGGVLVATPPPLVDTLGDAGSIHMGHKAYHIASKDFVQEWLRSAKTCPKRRRA